MGEVNMLWPDIKTQIDDPFLVMYCYYLYLKYMFRRKKTYIADILFTLHKEREKSYCPLEF